ncbi:hypothetical protein QV13_04535 [Mesorhizobium hungaricum]|uniref:Uncharacterized protein n=1 Tax=Mesorhizobium hungaricum TaxID=1566387 RepID=A0A1C2E6V3_9HYPH|nr:hypothetical protein QV13_04535 [Mesorhizobium hungaricum]
MSTKAVGSPRLVATWSDPFPQPPRVHLAEPRAGSGVPSRRICTRGVIMNGIIYLVGLIVIIMFILSFLGLR